MIQNVKTLRKGDRGAEVALLQRRLTRAGLPVEETHIFDTRTEDAVLRFQRTEGLVADGIVGVKTRQALAGIASPKRLTDADLVRAAHKLGVRVAAIRAVNEVESRGSGFLSDDRPVILFERHVFHRRLRSLMIDPEPLAKAHPNIVSREAGGYMGGAAEYVRLAAAERIDTYAARESTSWGAFQIMGYHWAIMGYDGVDVFIDKMHRSEGDHLDAFARFVKADSRLLNALVGLKWTAFAKAYNGPGYARNFYDVRLARAYEKYAGREAAIA